MKTKFLLFVLFAFDNFIVLGQGFNNTYEIINKGLALQRALEIDSCYIMSNNVSGVGFPTLDHEIFFKLSHNGELLQSKEFIFSKEFLSGGQPALCKISDSVFFFFHTVITDGSIIMAKLNTTLDTIWTKYYGADSLYPKFIRDAYFDSQTSTMVLCGRQRISSSVSDIWILRVSITDGTVVFDSTYNVSNVYHYVNRIIKSNDNGYLITGTQSGRWTLLKLDSLLHKQWFKQYYKYGGYESCMNAVQLPDSGFLLAGSFWTNFYQDDNYKCGVMRIDKNGNELWRKLYGYKGPNSHFLKIFETHDGNFICIGNTDSVYRHPTSGYMLKINMVGDELWHRYHYAGMIKGSYKTIVTDALQTQDNGYLISGHYYDCTGYYFDNCYTGFAIKTDSLGCDGWGSCDTSLRIETKYFRLSDNMQVYDGDTICLNDRIKVEFTLTGANDTIDYSIDLYLWTADPAITRPPPGSKLVATFFVENNVKYSYIYEPVIPALNGLCSFEIGLRGIYDYGPYFGSDYDGYAFGIILRLPIDTNCVVDINELLMEKDIINVYPNPASDILNVEYMLPAGIMANSSAVIYNILGVIGNAYTLETGITQINISHLSEGIYTLKVTDEAGNEFKAKFMKKK